MGVTEIGGGAAIIFGQAVAAERCRMRQTTIGSNRRALAISFELNEIWDPAVQRAVEAVIRDCIGERRREQDWKIWIHGSSDYCRVVVDGPQKRERFFFESMQLLPEKIREWLELYPFR